MKSFSLATVINIPNHLWFSSFRKLNIFQRDTWKYFSSLHRHTFLVNLLVSLLNPMIFSLFQFFEVFVTFQIYIKKATSKWLDEMKSKIKKYRQYKNLVAFLDILQVKSVRKNIKEFKILVWYFQQSIIFVIGTSNTLKSLIVNAKFHILKTKKLATFTESHVTWYVERSEPNYSWHPVFQKCLNMYTWF